MGTDRNKNWLGTLQQVIMTIWPAIVEVNQLGAYHLSELATQTKAVIIRRIPL